MLVQDDVGILAERVLVDAVAVSTDARRLLDVQPVVLGDGRAQAEGLERVHEQDVLAFALHGDGLHHGIEGFGLGNQLFHDAERHLVVRREVGLAGGRTAVHHVFGVGRLKRVVGAALEGQRRNEVGIDAASPGKVHHELFVVVLRPPRRQRVAPFLAQVVRHALLGHFALGLRTLALLVNEQRIAEEGERLFRARAFNEVVAFHTVLTQLHAQAHGDLFTGLLLKLRLHDDERGLARAHELAEILPFAGFHGEAVGPDLYRKRMIKRKLGSCHSCSPKVPRAAGVPAVRGKVGRTRLPWPGCSRPGHPRARGHPRVRGRRPVRR